MQLQSDKLTFWILMITTSVTWGQTKEFQPPDYLGEELYYVISYSFLHAGAARITFKTDSATQRSHIIADARTTGLANTLYRIRDIYECYMDPGSGRPYKAIRNVREGRYREYNEVIYDFNTREDSTIVVSQKSGTQVVQKNIYDILTGFFHLRKNLISGETPEGDTIFIQTYFTDEVWDLKVKYAGKEIIKTKLGKVKCLKYNPVTEVGRAFKTEDDMSIWFSDDENHIPVKIWVNLRIGSVSSELVDYRHLKFEFTSLEKKK